ncbi:MAG TPA: Crp/Fnr family transcriptional regulator [Alphaproteobacteria bacterium]|nr:Crp/Fnr family transcriptional regulator [Alphaproteobacteria bacterium]
MRTSSVYRPEEETIRLLRGCALFETLNERDMTMLARMCRVRQVERGALICGRGELGDSMMIVAAGRVRISSVSIEGREVILNEILPGQAFGEIAFLDGAERTADAAAIEPTRLLVLHRREFQPFLRERMELCLEVMHLLCQRLRHTTEQVEDLALRSLESRLARVLMALAESSGEAAADGSISFVPNLSQRELGEITGATRESVNKTLRLWRESGLAELHGKTFRIHDLEAFRSLVDRP